MSGLPFSGSFFSSWGSGCRCRGLCFFFFTRDSSGLTGHHTFPALVFGLLPFPFFCPRRACLMAHFGRVSPSFLVFSRVPLWAPAFWRFLDSLGTSWDLSSLAPSEAPFSDSRRQGRFGRFFSVVVVFPFLWLFAAAHVSRRPSRRSTPKWARKQVVSPVPWGSATLVWRFLRGGTKTPWHLLRCPLGSHTHACFPKSPSFLLSFSHRALVARLGVPDAIALPHTVL